ANAALLRILLHRRDLGFGLLRLATLADQLVDRRHEALHFLQVTLPPRQIGEEPWGPFPASRPSLRMAAVCSSKCLVRQRPAHGPGGPEAERPIAARPMWVNRADL